LRTTLQLCKVRTPFEVERKERGGKKLSSELLRSIKANSCQPTTYRVERCFRHRRRRLPMITWRRHTRYPFFFWIIERREHAWPHKIIPGKPRLKNLKYPLTLGKKKVDHKDYTVITLYKECENMKTPSDISCVVFFFQEHESNCIVQ